MSLKEQLLQIEEDCTNKSFSEQKRKEIDFLLTNKLVDVVSVGGSCLAVKLNGLGLEYLNKLLLAETPTPQHLFPVYKNGVLFSSRKGSARPKPHYPYETMELHDFFFVATLTVEEESSVKSSVNLVNKKNGVENGEKPYLDPKTNEVRLAPTYLYTKYFVARKIFAYNSCGLFMAPCTGMIVMRVAFDEV